MSSVHRDGQRDVRPSGSAPDRFKPRETALNSICGVWGYQGRGDGSKSRCRSPANAQGSPFGIVASRRIAVFAVSGSAAAVPPLVPPRRASITSNLLSNPCTLVLILILIADRQRCAWRGTIKLSWTCPSRSAALQAFIFRMFTAVIWKVHLAFTPPGHTPSHRPVPRIVPRGRNVDVSVT
jgi:hypothetical protein